MNRQLLPIASRHSPEVAARIRDADRIVGAALAAVDPRSAVRAALSLNADALTVAGRKIDLGAIDRLLVVGGGKAGAAMALGLIDVLGSRVTTGIINVKDGHRGELDDPRFVVHEASHPTPDARGLAGTREIAQLLATTTARDLVIVLLSGGASALLEQLPPGVTLDDLRGLTDALLRSGATIEEMNVVRKHVSQIKGGQLAGWAAPANVLSLVLSDVVSGALDAVASGPTVADPSTFDDALEVLRRRQIVSRVPAAILRHLERGLAKDIPETPKPGDPTLDPDRVFTHVVADIGVACEAARLEAIALGYDTTLETTSLEGEAREVGAVVAAGARELAAERRPAVVLRGGETTVTVRGTGRGGRNQELALAAAIALHRQERALVVSFATDGSDGPTDAAGGLATGTTFDEGARRGLDGQVCLANNDAYSFLQEVGDLVVTGPTGTNVCDLVLILVW